MLHEIETKPLLRQRVRSLQHALEHSKVFQPSNISKFVFLCGANKSKNVISERRSALLEFARISLPDTQFFLAEEIFETLQEERHKANLLEVEQLISSFSDYILIVLESPSSFTELGAFSHDDLRNKLIVINDSRHETAESFINLGPIKAIIESTGDKARAIHYRMSDDGISNRDSIGSTFNILHDILRGPLRPKSIAVDSEMCDPSKNLNKKSAMFLHDLVYFCGPLMHKEIIELNKLIFGSEKNLNNVIHLLAILRSFSSIERSSSGLYRASRPDTYFTYRFDTNGLISTFRNYTLKNYPERLYEA